MKTPRIVLASTSVYRKSLLERLGLSIECIAPGVDEKEFKQRFNDPHQIANRLARAKSEAVFRENPDAIVIGGDQIATIDGTLMDKPGTEENAARQLQALSAQTHELITAVCILSPGHKPMEHLDISRLAMRPLNKETIQRYIRLDMPLQCAGSYKIESAGIALFDRIETADHTAITGLPLIWVVSALQSIGISVP
jgi:septum formation protein